MAGRVERPRLWKPGSKNGGIRGQKKCAKQKAHCPRHQRASNDRAEKKSSRMRGRLQRHAQEHSLPLSAFKLCQPYSQVHSTSSCAELPPSFFPWRYCNGSKASPGPDTEWVRRLQTKNVQFTPPSRLSPLVSPIRRPPSCSDGLRLITEPALAMV